MAIFNTLLVFTVYSMNFVLLVGALFVIYICLSDQRQKELSENLAIDFEFYALFPKVLLAVSIIVAIVSFIGCFGIAIDNDYMLIVYVIILGILMISKIFLVIFLSHTLSNSKNAVGGDDLKRKILDSIKSNPTSPALSAIQKKYNCCGVDGPDDWVKLTERKEVPGSCCRKSDDEICDKARFFGKQGCKKIIWAKIENVLSTLIDLVIHVFIIEIMLVIFCILILMDIGQSGEDETSEEIVFVGRLKDVPTSPEDDVPFDEVIDTHDMRYKREHDVESPSKDEEIVGLHDDEGHFEESHEDETHEGESHDDDKQTEEKQEEESPRQEEKHEEEAQDEETHEDEKQEEEKHMDEDHEEEKHVKEKHDDQEEEIHDEETHEEEPTKEKRKKKKQKARH